MNKIANPEMVRLAREARGLTQTGLARESGLAQATISKVESSVLEASPSIVAAVAKGTKFPESFFYQTDPVYGAGTSEFFHRKRQAVPVGVLNTIHAIINVTRLHVARLLRAIELPECRIPALELGDFRSPSEVARAVRATLNVGPGPIPSVVKVIEDAGGLVVPCNFGTYEVDAISRWVPGLPPMFFVNRSAPVDRFRMNLAHELAHMVMHRLPEPEMEDQANEFAAEFLMPAGEIKQQLYGVTLSRLAALKPYWRTSMAALLKRSSDLKCITPGSARYLWIQMGQRGYRKREPLELDLIPERPTLLREIFQYYRTDLGYSVEDLAHALSSRTEDLMALYGLEFSRPETRKQFHRVK
jgi:Zn-dependent peptidase ImmA (M78 family)/transcriptional regulator with XRE-family HTH domain